VSCLEQNFSPSLDCSLQDWRQELGEDLPHDVPGVRLVPLDWQVENPDVVGAVVLLDIIDLLLKLLHFHILHSELLLELPVLLVGLPEEALQLVVPGFLLIEAFVGLLYLLNNIF
jgi:hypothetical protein